MIRESNVIPLLTGSYPQSHFKFESTEDLALRCKFIKHNSCDYGNMSWVSSSLHHSLSIVSFPSYLTQVHFVGHTIQANLVSV